MIELSLTEKKQLLIWIEDIGINKAEEALEKQYNDRFIDFGTGGKYDNFKIDLFEKTVNSIRFFKKLREYGLKKYIKQFNTYAKQHNLVYRGKAFRSKKAQNSTSRDQNSLF